MNNEDYIYQLAQRKANQMGFSRFQIDPVQFTLNTSETREIKAWNDHLFIVEVPEGVSVESDSGIYNKEHPAIKDHVIDHNGRILITNHTNSDKNVKFMQLSLISQ